MTLSWCHFVLACRLICQHQITHEQLQLADALLLQFCRRCECMVLNLLHPTCICMLTCENACKTLFQFMYFGSSLFERFNGILEKLLNNSRSIEIQLLKRFMESTDLLDLPRNMVMYSVQFSIVKSWLYSFTICGNKSRIHICPRWVWTSKVLSAECYDNWGIGRANKVILPYTWKTYHKY